MTIKERADALLDYMIKIRHDIHMHPELGLQEFHTTDRIAKELDKIGLDYKRFDPTGLMCDIKGNKPGNGFIGLRADIDALPIQECADVNYASKVDGVMHACGHDMHAAMLLGAAKILNDMRDEFGGIVRCIFQPSEENCLGAKTIIEQGAADGPKKFFAIHVWPDFAGSGKIGAFDIVNGAGVSNFQVKIKGVGCHGQSPQLGVDSLLIACEIVTSLQKLVSRRVSPFQSVVCSIGKINAGVAPNIVAEETTFEGTIRCHDPELTHKLKEWFYEMVEGIAKANGAIAEIDYDITTMPMVSDPELSKIVWGAADKISEGKAPCLNMGDVMGGEDFTMFMPYGPVVQCFIGGGGKNMGHQPDFVVYDEAMPYGAALFVQTTLDVLSTK